MIYHRRVLKYLALISVFACSGEKKAEEGAKADPWATGSAAPAATDDPWKTGTEPSLPAAEPDTQAPPEAPTARSTLAGRYECHQQRTTMVGGMFQSSFVMSALGVFVIDPDGTYRSLSYADKGDGHVQQRDNAVTFEGGAYPGSPGVIGTNSTGFYIRLSKDLSTPPEPDMKTGDHICYRQTKK